MQVNDTGIAIIKAFEGCEKPMKGRLGYFTPYYCPAGVLTVGYGHTNLGNIPPKVTAGTAWSYADCEKALRNDMRKFEQHVSRLGPEITDPNQYAAIVSWALNTGGPASSSVWKYARAGNVAETRVRLSRWNKGGGRILSGLVRRREAEADLFAGKVDEALRTAGVARGKAKMPQGVDVPKPPAAEIAKAAKRETTGAVAGTAAAGATASASENVGRSLAEWTLIGAGIAIAIVCIVLAVRKAREFAKDWA